MAKIESIATKSESRKLDGATLFAFIAVVILGGTNAVAVRFSNFELPPLMIAEGQNIIAFKATNKLGRSTQQFLRIIRSSTPLLPSEMHPVYEESVSEDPVLISFKLNDMKFLPEDAAGEVIKIIDFKIDGMDIPLEKLNPPGSE